MINKIVPFLSKYLPAGLAVKGISKINPKLGDFITTAASAGYASDSILDFLRDKIEPQGIKQERQRLQNTSDLRPDEMGNLQKLNDQGYSKTIPSAIGLGAGALASMGGNIPNQQPNQEQENMQQPSEQRNILQQYSPELFEFIRSEMEKGRSPLEAGALAEINGKFKKIIQQMVKDHKTPFSSILESIFAGTQAQEKNPSSSGSGQQALMQIMNKINQRLGG